MIIKNGLVFNKNFNFENKDLAIKDKKIINIEEINEKEEDIFNADGMYVIPGLIDTHTHGALGCDFCDADVESLITIAKYLKSKGVTAFCPTSMSLEKDTLKEIFYTANKDLPEDCSDILGIHMEGPFLSKAKKGAQNEKYIQTPEIGMFKELNKASNNRIKILTMSPSVDSALNFIETMAKEVNISVGHTTADYETSKKAFSLGANRVTHLYNAMPPYTHRDPGVIGAAYDNKDIFVELICDGVHVHESVVRATFDMFGSDRVVLISDCIRATGMKNGTYELGGQPVYVKDKMATLSDGTIAGSATNLMECMKKAVSFGIPLELAVKAASVNPAKSIGVYDKMGSLEVGKKANIVILNKNLEVMKVI